MEKRLGFRFVNSYMVILLVALILMAAVSSIGFNLFEKDAMNKNILLLDYVKETFDNRFSEISKLGYEINCNKQLLNISKSRSFIETDNAVQLSQTLNIFKATNDIIDEISIYFPNSNQVVTSTGKFFAHQFYRLYHEDNPEDYRRYFDMLNSGHILEYTVSRDIPNNKKEEHNIYFYNSLYSDEENVSMPLLIIRVDRDKIVPMINSVVRVNREYFAIMDGRNHIIAEYGNKELLERAMEGTSFDSIPVTANKQAGSLMILQAASLYAGMRYISISEKSDLLEVFYTGKNLLVIGALFILIVDMLIAFYFSKRNERPIRAMTAAISRNSQPMAKDADVYVYLEDNIRKILNENDMFSKSLKKQEAVLKNQFLVRLLQGSMTDFSEYLKLCGQYHIDISRRYHTVLIPYVHRIDSQLEQSGADMADFGDAVFALITASVKQINNEVCSAEPVKLEGIYGIWLTTDGDEHAPAMKAEEYSRRLIREVYDCYGITLSIASGNVYDNWNQIALSCSEALQTMDRLIACKGGSYLDYASIKKEEQHEQKKVLELLSKYINCLKLEDYGNVLQMTNALFSEYLSPRLSKNIYTLHRNTLVSVIMDAVGQAGSIYGQPDYCQCYYRLQGAAQKTESLKKAIADTIQEIMDSKCKYEQLKYSGYTNTLREFIDQNYTDPNLGLYMIAEHFKMNNTYLSKLFKNEFNIGVLEYINKIRIKKAKEMLADTADRSIMQISQAVGYISDITFIRVFKRYEGTTPGRYKEWLNKERIC